MIIVMRMGTAQQEIDVVLDRIKELGYEPHVSSGEERVIIGVVGNDRPVDKESFLSLKGVDSIVPILAPYKLASRDFKAEDTEIKVGSATFGGTGVGMMAGPCSVESRDQTLRIAEKLANMGVNVLRGGAFKPRTSPYS